jgi:hypothetical protein
MILSISYDLKKPGRNYDDLYETIKSAPSWAHAMDSLWFISTGESVETWSNRLRQVMDQNDWLFVVDITGQSCNGWMKKEIWEWLEKHNRRS